jgi:two-component system, chemotaxis family, protein-glutamate methylesterase/glutaminase
MGIKLLIVDDSALMRRALVQIFENAGGFEIQTAHDGVDALRAVREWSPQVITLDINMPKMDGMTALSQLMVECPTPVVMVSSLTQKDALPTLEALALGAVDFVAKPSGTVSRDIRKVEEALVQKVRLAASAHVRRARTVAQRLRHVSPVPHAAPACATPPRQVSPRSAPAATPKGRESLVMIGVSTGGPRTLEQILPLLPADFPVPVLVVIHMPATFTGHFARRMNDLCALDVVEVTHPTPLLPGKVYLSRGEADMIVARRSDALVAMLSPSDQSLAWHPSVDRMVESAMRHVAPEGLIGVQLTGMGDDGASAMKQLHTDGGRTIAESADTAVVYGMPKELVDRGGATVVLPCTAIAEQILSWTSKGV